MNLELITRDDLASDLGLLDNEGTPRARGVADLLRVALSRWGISPRRTLLRFVREQIDAVRLRELIPTSDVNKVLDLMISFGECQEVLIGHERYIAPSQPRWIRTGNNSATFLSVSPVPDGAPISNESNPHEITQRIKPLSLDALGALQFAGVIETSITEWLCPLDYLRFGARRLRRVIRDDTLNLSGFWDCLVSALSEDGYPIGDDADLRILTGPRGGFFGRHEAAEPEGRWQKSAGDGVWCAYRRGYGDLHWHPILLDIDGNNKRCLDLYDTEEWRWALVARGLVYGEEEVAQRTEEKLTFSYPLPSQLRAAMDLLGERDGPWSWIISAGSPDFFEFLR